MNWYCGSGIAGGVQVSIPVFESNGDDSPDVHATAAIESPNEMQIPAIRIYTWYCNCGAFENVVICFVTVATRPWSQPPNWGIATSELRMERALQTMTVR